MKKHKISKFYIGIYLAGAIVLLSRLALGIYMLMEFADVYSIVLTAVPAFGCAILLYQILFDFHFGSFCVDNSGITMNIGFKSYFHAWESVVDYGFVQADVGDGNTYWLYFSERDLSYDEKHRFLRKTRRDLDDIAFFQYNTAILEEILPFLPERLANHIRNEEPEIRERMTCFEKIYHK